MNKPQAELTYQSTSAWENELIGVIGYDPLIRLEQAFGGSYLYIHSNAPSLEIIRIIGPDAAHRLSDWYGSSDIYVPLVALRAKRNRDIHKGRNTGKSIKALADKFRLTTKRIRDILKEQQYG